MLIHQHIRGGDGLLLAIGMAVALSDIGAFAVGETFGRHALAPRLSPNKTVEGVAGNVLGAYAGFGIMFFAIPGHLMGWPIAILPAIVGIGAVGGDLIESAVKRRYTVKDAGSWLPGFGGLLDRIDSLLLVVPLFYYFSAYAVF